MKVGTIVMLKSGGPNMTINSVTDNVRVEATYFDCGQVYFANFNKKALIKIIQKQNNIGFKN